MARSEQREGKGVMGESMRVLLIEDNPADARLIQLYLSEADPQLHVELERATSLAEGLSQLKEDPADVVLLDLMLPDSEGLRRFAWRMSMRPLSPSSCLRALKKRH